MQHHTRPSCCEGLASHLTACTEKMAHDPHPSPHQIVVAILSIGALNTSLPAPPLHSGSGDMRWTPRRINDHHYRPPVERQSNMCSQRRLQNINNHYIPIDGPPLGSSDTLLPLSVAVRPLWLAPFYLLGADGPSPTDKIVHVQLLLDMPTTYRSRWPSPPIIEPS